MAQNKSGVRTVQGLRVKKRLPGLIELASRSGSMQVSVLAEDLIRVRVTANRDFSSKGSWAVQKMDWPVTQSDLQLQNGSLVVKTNQGAFHLSFQTGGWRLVGREGVYRFHSLPGATVFEKEAPRLSLELIPGEHFFGLGETTGPFNRIGLRRELWNIDVLGHAPGVYPGLRSLYASIPFAISLRHGVASGIFWDNPARQVWNFGELNSNRLDIAADAGEIDLYLFLGPRLSDVLARHTELTGRMPLPPLWALGYHQSRYSYESAKELTRIAREFRKRQIPCDALYLDIHHMDGYRVFTFGKSFPNPSRLIGKLARDGFRVVAIVDPGVKNDPRFGVLKRGIAQGAFVKSGRGRRDYIGKVWPGPSRFPDFTREAVRKWWGCEQTNLQAKGVAGFWNDMNEPANFALPSKTLPEDCRHDSDFGPMSHKMAHNIYGLQMARASREGALRFRPSERPFVISRAGYAGIQRQALVWTGDNSSFWEHLQNSIPMLLNLSLSGVAFCGADVGGFLENCSGELLARWTQLAAFTPFFRNHSNLGTRAQEPWAFGSQIEAICKTAIEFRYQIIPYLFCLFAEAHATGAPIMRPIFWDNQNDPTALGINDQFLLGPSLMIAPIVHPGARARSVYLPTGTWFDLWTGQRHDGNQHVLALADLDRIPVYVRGGSIIPMGPVQQYADETPWTTITLHLWPDGVGKLNWCEDNPASQELLAGERLIHRDSRRLTFEPETSEAVCSVKIWRIVWRSSRRPLRVLLDWREIDSRFDSALGTCVAEIPNRNSRIEISWR